MKFKKVLKKRSAEPQNFIISYPKTGRTWLRALLGSYLSFSVNLPEKEILETEKITAAADLPVTSFTHDGSALKENRHYQELSEDKSRFVDKKVVLLGRDPRDTLVSAYFQASSRLRIFDGPISDFIRNDLYGLRKILTFYRIWYTNRDLPTDFIFIRYEDMHRDVRSTLTTVLKFLGQDFVDVESLDRAVEFCSFQNLRKAEEENRFDNRILRPKDIKDEESYKLRKGKVNNYGEYLTDDDLEYIDRISAKEGCAFTAYVKSGS